MTDDELDAAPGTDLEDPEGAVFGTDWMSALEGATRDVLAAQLRLLRLRHGLTRADICAHTGLDLPTVAGIETPGHRSVRLSWYQRYVRALGGRLIFSIEYPPDGGAEHTVPATVELRPTAVGEGT